MATLRRGRSSPLPNSSRLPSSPAKMTSQPRFVPSPKLLESSIKSRKNDITTKTKVTVCEARDGTDFKNGEVLVFPTLGHQLSTAWCTLMVIPPPVRPPRITQFLKPDVLKMHFTNKYVSAQVFHSPTAFVATSTSSQEKALRASLENTRDVAAAAKIGKILAERPLLKNVPDVAVNLKREQKYHGKGKVVVDSLRDVGVKLL